MKEFFVGALGGLVVALVVGKKVEKIVEEKEKEIREELEDLTLLDLIRGRKGKDK